MALLVAGSQAATRTTPTRLTSTATVLLTSLVWPPPIWCCTPCMHSQPCRGSPCSALAAGAPFVRASPLLRTLSHCDTPAARTLFASAHCSCSAADCLEAGVCRAAGARGLRGDGSRLPQHGGWHRRHPHGGLFHDGACDWGGARGRAANRRQHLLHRPWHRSHGRHDHGPEDQQPHPGD